MPLTLQNLESIMHHGRIRVRVDPLLLTPVGGLAHTVCQQVPSDLCTELGPSLMNLQNLVGLLTGSRP